MSYLVITPRWIRPPNFFLTIVPIGCCSFSSSIVLNPFAGTLGAVRRPTLGGVAVSSTLDDAAASLFLGGWKMLVNFQIASFVAVPCCRKGVLGCGFFSIALKSSKVAASQSSDDVVGICTCFGKKLTVDAMQTPPVSGM